MHWDVSKGLEGLDHNFVTGKLEDLVKWARRMSVMPATFGLACLGCAAVLWLLAGRGVPPWWPRGSDLSGPGFWMFLGVGVVCTAGGLLAWVA